RRDSPSRKRRVAEEMVRSRRQALGCPESRREPAARHLFEQQSLEALAPSNPRPQRQGPSRTVDVHERQLRRPAEAGKCADASLTRTTAFPTPQLVVRSAKRPPNRPPGARLWTPRRG